MNASFGFSIKSWADHSRADGYLIYRDIQREREPWKGYDKWRGEVCERNRDKQLWLPFREGNVNETVLLYALFLKLIRR